MWIEVRDEWDCEMYIATHSFLRFLQEGINTTWITNQVSPQLWRDCLDAHLATAWYFEVPLNLETLATSPATASNNPNPAQQQQEGSNLLDLLFQVVLAQSCSYKNQQTNSAPPNEKIILLVSC